MRILIYILLLNSISSISKAEPKENFNNKSQYLLIKERIEKRMLIDGTQNIVNHTDESKSEKVTPNSLSQITCPDEENMVTYTDSHGNLFDKTKSKILDYCSSVLFGVFNLMNCKKLVKDVFEVGSPYCGDGLPDDKLAESCVMGLDYLVHKFESNPHKYSKAIEKLDQLITEYSTNQKEIDFDSYYDLALKACNGNKILAIEIMSMEKLGEEGLRTFVMKLKKFPSKALSILHKYINSDGQGVFSAIQRSHPDKKFRSIPKRHQHKVKERKEYHYWARALMSAGLVEKGYNSMIARQISTMTSAVYELYFDWKEHVAQGQPKVKIASAAFNDILISDCGSELGSRVEDPIFSPSCVGMQSWP